MIDNSQIVSSVVVDETGAVIVLELWHFGSHDSRPDNLEEGKFWSCTYRAVIKAACAIQERDGVIPESEVFVSPDEGWEGETDVTRAQKFVTAKFPGWKRSRVQISAPTLIRLAAVTSSYIQP